MDPKIYKKRYPIDVQNYIQKKTLKSIKHLCENLNISKNQAMMIVQSSDPFKPFWIEIEKEL